MTDTQMTIEAELESIEERRSALEARARNERADAIDRLKAICKITGPISADLLDGVIAPKKRGAKAGVKKTRKPRAAKESQPEVTA